MGSDMAKIASQNGTPSDEGRGRKLRATNSSGYPGVSWDKRAGKWGAYIRRDGARRYLGMFRTAEEAYAAYAAADARLSRPKPGLEEERASVVAAARARFEEGGFDALNHRALAKVGLKSKMQRLGITRANLLISLGLAHEFQRHRQATFKYRGEEKPRWSWEQAIVTASDLLETEGDLPTIPWCRKNGQSHLVNVVFQTGHTWEELREAIGLPPSPRFYQSRSGLRWRSRPEACLSNFLHARRIEHRRGEPYPDGYAEASGRARARYDMHFRAADGEWINVEVWGNLSGDHFGGDRYAETRRLKEDWHAGDPRFLGVDHQDCLSDDALTAILAPYIGVVAPTNVARETDGSVETAHWSNADELLESCRRIAAAAPGGIFPSEEWLRKRGKFADRDGPPYHTVAVYAQKWLGGIRKVRALLNQDHASTTKWDVETVKVKWAEFSESHGLTPAQANLPEVRKTLPPKVSAEACRIYAAARRLDVRDTSLNIRVGRKIYWTAERTIAEWKAFFAELGCSPTECMSASKRARLPKAICDRATRIYGAALRLGITDACRRTERA